MAKKKKGRTDARGYGQQQQQQQQQSKPKASETVVTSRTHDGLKNLLGALENEQTSSSFVAGDNGTATRTTTVFDLTRFTSNLTTMIDRLEELGFNDRQMEQVVSALGYEMTTLERALDWLCLNLSTLELPPLFTDGRLRDSLSTITTEQSLTVLKFLAPPETTNNFISKQKPGDEATQQNQKSDALLLLAKQKEEAEKKAQKKLEEEAKKEQEEAAARKAWLLQQYEFEAHDDDDDGMHAEGFNGDDNVNEDPKPASKEAETAVEEVEEEESQLLLTPQQLELAEKEKELKALEADVNDEANNYMRSKQETKQLHTDAKRLRQQVTGLRKQIEKGKAKAKSKRVVREEEDPELVAEREMAAENGHGEEAGGGGLFDIFGGSTTPAPDPAPAQEESTPPAQLMDLRISKNWTGTTPQKTFDELCKKLKLPKPKYFKLPKNSGYRLSALFKKKGTPKEWRAESSDFVKGTSLHDYMAVQALYEFDPTIPLYRVFPPPFRDLWLSWLKEVEQEKEDATNEKDTAKRERLDRLLSLIPTDSKSSQTATTTTSETTPSKVTEHDKFIAPESEEDWETQASADESAPDTRPVSARGKKLRDAFIQRRASPEYKKMLQVRSTLPMSSYQQEVLDTIRNNPVTILCAETGAGKTTQCPQYLLEEALLSGRGDEAEIICTQPRRVAATSVAERVADEMCHKLGRMVGYQIRMESKRSAETQLLFCTTGVILKRLQGDSSLKGVSHVIVDEVHERQQQTDVLLIALRLLLRGSRPDLKIILVCAIFGLLTRSCFPYLPLCYPLDVSHHGCRTILLIFRECTAG
jgi:ATP-dependent RNA helicase DHX29